jgi:hypothetical protein
MKRINSKSLLFIANVYILLSIVFYWFETSSPTNPVAMAFLAIFGLHLFVAKGNARLIFPGIFIIINLFMFLALFSEFNEFPTLCKEAITLLIVGTLYLGANITSSIIMLRSYFNPSVVRL